MSRTEFFRRVVRQLNGDPEDVLRVAHAYWLAKEVHRTQKRDGGERYFEHCRRVALLTMDHGCYDADSVIIALLHDALEDSFIPLVVVRQLFGAGVEEAICALSKTETTFYEYDGSVRKIKKDPAKYFEDIKIHPNVVVPVIKCCDRLDNLRTFGIWPVERKVKYVIETREYLLPLASEAIGGNHPICKDLKNEVERLASEFNLHESRA
ncbi:MAG: bifunctional (p)ppGpp synthetase/guanosine-3',5'-bis(diphosphate) 3'-pyrophosphohydrolase [Candidatus Niyogibacteria bacterium]|nr:MAG: bifunctional (p)ppGpp synthetase/guanosine-3',5'-bis(diphosphate) 3'-pyrophosphohydrolase [Candidatus Niyogibacteria bacterium]